MQAGILPRVKSLGAHRIGSSGLGKEFPVARMTPEIAGTAMCKRPAPPTPISSLSIEREPPIQTDK